MVPELGNLERKLVPHVVSLNKFDLILFLLCADYFPLNFEELDDSASTVDTSGCEKSFGLSEFLKKEIEKSNFSYEDFYQIEEDFCIAADQDYHDSFW